MSLTTPHSVQKLQATLHAKAKDSPTQRFHALYDKVYRKDVLAHAYARCRANKGAQGVDNQTFEDIEEYGLEQWLEELTQELKNQTYKPQAVRRAYIAKPDGKQRPLGIPTIRDRVVQMSAVLVLGPIFEADLPPEQYAYRENRSALDAVEAVHKLLIQGYREVVDADLSGYFDSVPHAELMKSVARRVVDGAMLHLIKMWLEAPVEETDDEGKKHRSTRNRDEGRGTPQGSPISPLLSNLYMRRFVVGCRKLGHQARLAAHIGTAIPRPEISSAIMPASDSPVGMSSTQLDGAPGPSVNKRNACEPAVPLRAFELSPQQTAKIFSPCRAPSTVKCGPRPTMFPNSTRICSRTAAGSDSVCGAMVRTISPARP